MALKAAGCMRYCFHAKMSQVGLSVLSVPVVGVVRVVANEFVVSVVVEEEWWLEEGEWRTLEAVERPRKLCLPEIPTRPQYGNTTRRWLNDRRVFAPQTRSSSIDTGAISRVCCLAYQYDFGSSLMRKRDMMSSAARH